MMTTRMGPIILKKRSTGTPRTLTRSTRPTYLKTSSSAIQSQPDQVARVFSSPRQSMKDWICRSSLELLVKSLP